MMPRARQHLKFKGITPKTARAYKKEIRRFFQFLSSEGVALPDDVAELDYQLAEFINALYHEGDTLTQAGWPLSGFKRFLPRLKFKLPTAQQYYNNWLRDHILFVQFQCPGLSLRRWLVWLGGLGIMMLLFSSWLVFATFCVPWSLSPCRLPMWWWIWRPLRLLSLLIVPRRQSSISNLCCCGTGLWPASLAMPFHDCLAGSVFGLPQPGIFANVSLAWCNIWVSKTGFSLYSIGSDPCLHPNPGSSLCHCPRAMA